MLLAGQYRPERLDIVGPMATDTLNNLRGYVAFLGTDGISRDFGITSADIESANIHKLAAQNARECILLADHSKFDDPALYKIEDFKLISTVITDKKPDEKWCKFFNKQNINVIFPQEKLNSNQEQK
jgi:DeoR family fructose operon transcriptional repressor